MANCCIYQSMGIYSLGAESHMIGFVYTKAVMTEVFQFKITAANWNFTPLPQFNTNPGAEKKLKLQIPKAPNEGLGNFETKFTKGPKYCWASAGEFAYAGTELSLSQEAIMVTVTGKEGVQGKAVVSLASAGDYPIAQGMIKKVCQTQSEYVQGRVGGNLSVTKKSIHLKDDQVDEGSSVMPPVQPPTTLITHFLSPKLQYLIVELYSADGLPCADQDTGTSNPFARVKFDGMVQQSDHVDNSLAPVFNSTFYFPVRVPDESIRTNKAHYANLLPVEMQSKGYLEVELWHMDNIPTEFLGVAKIDLHRTRMAVDEQKAICDKVASSKNEADDEEGEADEEGDVSMGLQPGLAKKHKTKVLSLIREKLTGSWLQSVTKPTVTFDCYFVPDFPDGFRYLEQVDGLKGDGNLPPFAKSFKQWDEYWPMFAENYRAWFPDSLEGRRFVSQYKDASGGELPLACLINPLALPESLEEPQSVLHWTRCMEFQVSSRQRAVGKLSNWSPVETILSLRKGTVQDHAVVLCCALVGLREDAFVCKGTLQGGKEHAWVMSREPTGTVTFWETTTGAKYHLPNRWLDDPQHTESTKAKAIERWKARKANKKWDEMASERAALSRKQHFQHMGDLTSLPIAPCKELYHGDNLVVVPYETVEVVFNGDQVWGNCGNAHPACIHYDMEEDQKLWQPLIVEDDLPLLSSTKGSVIPVGPALSDYSAECVARSAESELRECVRMVRMRLGHESYFVEDPLLAETTSQFLSMLEQEARLDADWCHDDKGELQRRWCGVTSPFSNFQYVQNCKEAWKKHWDAVKDFERDKKQLPVKPNHQLSGTPLHFSSCDLKEIRYHLLNCENLHEYFHVRRDDIIYFVSVKIFPMPSSIASTWVFVGALIPLSNEEVIQLAQEEAVKQMESGGVGEDEHDELIDERKKAKKKKKKKEG
eukprot:TRINITY_DN23916_c0_g2_i1.p1 TRINITY_DN23916_c0_g2~~TRINITY_DN23916_c0_g2_i1.p1  ORF type:complete len:1082 (-),score=180.99 TRINITY_DN23916_c0_g2_i1:521-3319(-)